jgi:type I restriction enzyme, S subunit
MTQRQHHQLGDLFRSRRQPGRAGLPVLSVTMGDGLVNRDTLERKTSGGLAPEEHLLIRKGDIAYNMMRMWQGASGLADKDGIVSPAYVVLAPRDGIDPLFASYWFKSARMIHLFWAYSYGITGDRLRLYYKDFAKIPVSVPRKQEQERFGRTFAAIERAIERTSDLIAARRNLQKALAQHVLLGKRWTPGEESIPAGARTGRDKRAELPTGWRYRRLEKLATFKSGGTPSKERADFWAGGVPWVTARDLKSHVLNRTWLTITPTAVMAGASMAPAGAAFVLVRGMTLLKDVPIGVASREMSFNQDVRAIIPRKGVNSEYLGRFLAFAAPQLRRFVTIAGHGTGRLEMDSLRALPVALPPAADQARIAAVLGAAERQVLLLEQKLAALRELKKGLMQKLLDRRMEEDSSGSLRS